jgi:hypothetical protein
MSTELAIRPSGQTLPSASEINTIALLANHLAKSGRFKDATNGYEAFAKLMFGRDLGLSATAAMTGVHIVEGKPEIGANIHAQMVKTYLGREGERYDYQVLHLTDDLCRLQFKRRWQKGGEWEVLGDYEYRWSDAERAQLTSKNNWKKHPRNMLFARAMSDGVAFYCPEVTNGVRTYHEGEIDPDGTITTTTAIEVTTVPVGAEADAIAEGVLDGVVVEPEPDTDSQPAPLVSGESIAELQAAAKGLTVSQLRLAFGAAGVPFPDGVEPAEWFARVPAAMGAELAAQLVDLGGR